MESSVSDIAATLYATSNFVSPTHRPDLFEACPPDFDAAPAAAAHATANAAAAALTAAVAAAATAAGGAPVGAAADAASTAAASLLSMAQLASSSFALSKRTNSGQSLASSRKSTKQNTSWGFGPGEVKMIE